MNKKKVSRKNEITTVKILKETKLRIEKLREHKRETYDNILRKILYVLNATREDPDKAKRILERIEDLRRRMFEEEAEKKKDEEADRQREKDEQAQKEEQQEMIPKEEKIDLKKKIKKIKKRK
jgi:hypothetical protein